MCIFHLSKVLIYEFHHGYIKNKYDNKSRLLFTDAEGWIRLKSKFYNVLNKLLVSKIKEKAVGVPVFSIEAKTILVFGRW